VRDPERRREAHLEFPLLCEGPGLVLSTSGLGGPVSSLLLEEGPTPQVQSPQVMLSSEVSRGSGKETGQSSEKVLTHLRSSVRIRESTKAFLNESG